LKNIINQDFARIRPNCILKKTVPNLSRFSAGQSTRNVFEVIGRWLLGMAEYFEMLIRTLRKFGEFLIEIAKQGYGADLRFPT
jgi:hypothetical protein